MVKKAIFAALTLGAMYGAIPANARTVLVNQAYTFRFDETGEDIYSGATLDPLFGLGINPTALAAPDGPWTFTLDAPGTITFGDLFLPGDQFQIKDFGKVIGTTSPSVVDTSLGANCGRDIALCTSRPTMSQGTFALAAGQHSISGIALVSAFGSGSAFFIVTPNAVAPVPEPTTWALMILGFGVVGAQLRRRSRVNATVRLA